MSYDKRQLTRADVNRQRQRSPAPAQPTADVGDQDEGGYDDQWPGRLPSSSRSYAPLTTQGNTGYTLHPTQVQRVPIPARRSALPPAGRMTEERPAPTRRRSRGLFRSHPLLWVGFGMLVMLLAWTSLQALGAWWSLHQDDVTYGRPRTAQYDVVVGQNDSPSSPTHFLALNLDATVVVIELPGGDSSKARIYRGPQLFGPGANLYPVTLSFPDPTVDGKPNMEVHVQGQIFVYLNQNGQFVPQVSSH
jgi:hypothetical protein